MQNNFWNNLRRPVLLLAPMVGVSDTAFRQLCKGFGADVVYSEMISADALVRNAEKALAMLAHDTSEYPFVVQLMGNKPNVLGEAARVAEKAGASGIDINFGCPAHKIARNDCGVMLMRDLDRCRDLLSAVLDAVDIPISIKARVSIKPSQAHKSIQGSSPITILDMIQKVSDLPIAALMLHGRSFEDSFDGGIRHNAIAEAKKIFKTGAVFANGGITSVESSRDILDSTGADGLGLARSVIGKPWLFKQIRDYLDTGSYTPVEWPEIKSVIIEHAELFERTRGKTPFKEVRRHLTHYVKGHERASEIRQKLVTVESVSDIRIILKKY
jgi:tRNA-dihydrouridine synthase B